MEEEGGHKFMCKAPALHTIFRNPIFEEIAIILEIEICTNIIYLIWVLSNDKNVNS